MSTPEPEHPEPHGSGGLAERLNWLRAGVLGANDGIVSTASIVVGVAGANSSHSAIVTAGLAGMFAGAMSMASGEYVSVGGQRDSQRAQLNLEKRELEEMSDEELDELAGLYQAKGLSRDLAHQVAVQLTERNALAAHAEVELNIDPNELLNPWHAAFASFLSFTIGALLPLLAIALTSASVRLGITVGVVLLALVVTGTVSARLGGSPTRPAVIRNVVGGGLAMGVTYGIGTLVAFAGV